MGNLEFRVLKKIRCIYFIGTGNIPYKYLINKIMDVQKHPDFNISFNIFVEFKRAVLTFKDEGFDLYESFFQKLQQSSIPKKIAIYTEEEMTLKTANMHHLNLSGVVEVKVFMIRDMALSFLGITNEDLADY